LYATCHEKRQIMVNKLISSQQCEAARAWLRWTRETLAEKAKVSVRTIARFESGETVPGDGTLHHIARALEDAGIVFLFDGARASGIEFDATKAKPVDAA
jgi:transcriptional regulator with XRE-family HTH domain